jgi:hypothetical protein
VTSEQAKAYIDDLFARVESHVGRDFLRRPFEVLQGFIDANWNTIWSKVPTSQDEEAMVGLVFDQVTALAISEPWLLPLIGMIRQYVVRFFGS